MLCSFLFTNKKEEKETFVDRIMKLRYLVMLDKILRHRYFLLVIMGSLLTFTIWLIPKLGGEFMPPLEEGNLDQGDLAANGHTPGSGAHGSSARG